MERLGTVPHSVFGRCPLLWCVCVRHLCSCQGLYLLRCGRCYPQLCHMLPYKTPQIMYLCMWISVHLNGLTDYICLCASMDLLIIRHVNLKLKWHEGCLLLFKPPDLSQCTRL